MINVYEKFDNLTDYFSPKIIGEVNDVYVKLAKIKGDRVPWHNHQDEDELFYIIEGSLLLEIEGEDSYLMNKGDMHIVRKGSNHKVSSIKECKILLIENKSTAHTGDVHSEITKSVDDQLG